MKFRGYSSVVLRSVAFIKSINKKLSFASYTVINNDVTISMHDLISLPFIKISVHDPV